ncbi:DUF1857-domain-containing protein [Mycena amicta]|nr:DUF1857-domain-containing protein [Mycena amicta]
MPHAFAATRPVNPPGVEPVITEEQLWKALEYKARNPQAFVPMIISCKVTVDDGKKVPYTRSGIEDSPEVVVETIDAYASTIVYFEMSSGKRVTNTVSYGLNNELLLTYSFANGIPGVPDDKPSPSKEEMNATLGMGVNHSIAVVRELVKAGKV